MKNLSTGAGGLGFIILLIRLELIIYGLKYFNGFFEFEYFKGNYAPKICPIRKVFLNYSALNQQISMMCACTFDLRDGKSNFPSIKSVEEL